MTHYNVRYDLRSNSPHDLSLNSRYHFRPKPQHDTTQRVTNLIPPPWRTVGEIIDLTAKSPTTHRSQPKQTDHGVEYAHHSNIRDGYHDQRKRSRSPAETRLYRSRSPGPFDFIPNRGLASAFRSTSPQMELVPKTGLLIDLTSPSPEPAPSAAAGVRQVIIITEKGTRPVVIHQAPREYKSVSQSPHNTALAQPVVSVWNKNITTHRSSTLSNHDVTGLPERPDYSLPVSFKLPHSFHKQPKSPESSPVVIDLTEDDSETDSSDLSSSSSSSSSTPSCTTPLSDLWKIGFTAPIVIQERDRALAFGQKMVILPAIIGSSHYHVMWTDGSLPSGGRWKGPAGSAVVWKEWPTGRWKSLKRNLGYKTALSYVPELQAITMAMEKAPLLIKQAREARQRYLNDQVLIFTDCSRCLDMITKAHRKIPRKIPQFRLWLGIILNSSEELKKLGATVELHWVPGHKGVLGNELADREANLAADMDTCPREADQNETDFGFVPIVQS